MWPRAAEMAIGIWLMMSPWVLVETTSASSYVNELICGAAIVTLSAISYLPAVRRAHLAEIPIIVWLLVSTYFGITNPAPELAPSNVLAALFLLNFAIIPSQANVPPNGWRTWPATSDGEGRE